MIVMQTKVSLVASLIFCLLVDINALSYTASGRWTSDEQNLFMKGLYYYGKDWRSVTNFIKTRTIAQVCEDQSAEV